MGQFEISDDEAFLTMVNDAREIVLVGAAGLRIPTQRIAGAYVDVTADAILQTEGMAAYGC